jgi:hypothetical protein
MGESYLGRIYSMRITPERDERMVVGLTFHIQLRKLHVYVSYSRDMATFRFDPGITSDSSFRTYSHTGIRRSQP